MGESPVAVLELFPFGPMPPEITYTDCFSKASFYSIEFFLWTSRVALLTWKKSIPSDLAFSFCWSSQRKSLYPWIRLQSGGEVALKKQSKWCHWGILPSKFLACTITAKRRSPCSIFCLHTKHDERLLLAYSAWKGNISPKNSNTVRIYVHILYAPEWTFQFRRNYVFGVSMNKPRMSTLHRPFGSKYS